MVPGWHGTIFAPYFVAGAIYSGLGMVLTLIIPLRRALKIEHMITEYHFDNLAKLTLLTGSHPASTPTAMEYFVAWYSGNTFEQTTFFRRAFGPHVVGRLDHDHLQRRSSPSCSGSGRSAPTSRRSSSSRSSSTSGCGSSAT